MSAISTWSSLAAATLNSSPALTEVSHGGHKLTFHQLADSFWMISEAPNGSRIGFRLFYSGHEIIKASNIEREGNSLHISLEGHSASYQTVVSFPGGSIPLVRYTTTIRANHPLTFPFTPRDILPLPKRGKAYNSSGVVHAAQQGNRSGLVYFSTAGPLKGSVLYFQNLTALGEFCEATRTSSKDLVGGTWPEIGFTLPVVAENPLPAGKDFVIADAFVLFDAQVPADNFEVTRSFLDHLAIIYRVLPRPETTYHNWPDIAERGLNDIANHKGCWTYADLHPYLNAYVSDYKTPPEIMVQLSVLLPLIEYQKWKGQSHDILNTLRQGLPHFYDDKLKTIVRWLPSKEDNLDRSEEQKREGVMDSWYLHHPLTNLARLSKMGDTKAHELLMKSIDYVINVAHHFEYNWPVFYKMDTLEVVKAETEPGKGGEKDVPGAYAHLMLEMWDITGDRKYFLEAKRAARQLAELGFNIFYQANNTAFTAGAMVRLYKETGDETYLKISYACIASIMRNVQLWDCNYGNGKYLPTFFSMFPLNDAPYIAAYEEQEVFSAFAYYLKQAKGIKLAESVTLLIAEFMKYAITRLPYYYPPMLPKDIFSQEVKTGELDPALWIPLEDIHDGWEASGEVGQEVYGAGIAFGIVARQFHSMPEGFTVFIEYPTDSVRRSKHRSVNFKLNGDPQMSCRVLILLHAEGKKLDFTARKNKSIILKPNQVERGSVEYIVSGGCSINISWK